jgi:hypothetical protein
MLSTFRSWAVVACVLVVSTLAAADRITFASDGLTAPTGTITFDFQSGFYDGYSITDQYLSLGATFSGFGWDNRNLGQAGATDFVGGDLANGFTFFPGGYPSSPAPMTISFTNAVSGAAFAAVDNGGQYLVEAYLGTTLVDSFTVAIGGTPGGYIGFDNEPSRFDTIKITPSGATSLSIDNLEFITAPDPPTPDVPEPASAILFTSGLAASAALRRRFAKRPGR